MPIDEGGGASGGFVSGGSAKTGTYSSPPAQSAPSGGSGDGGAAQVYPGRPSGFGAPWTGWTGTEADAFVRRLPGASFERTVSSAFSSAMATVTFTNLRHNDGVVIPDSSGASFMVPDSLAGHDLFLTGRVRFTASCVGTVSVQETLRNGTARSAILSRVIAPDSTGAFGVYNYTLFAGQGTTGVSFFDLQARTSGGAATVSSATLTILQVR